MAARLRASEQRGWGPANWYGTQLLAEAHNHGWYKPRRMMEPREFLPKPKKSRKETKSAQPPENGRKMLNVKWEAFCRARAIAAKAARAAKEKARSRPRR